MPAKPFSSDRESRYFPVNPVKGDLASVDMTRLGQALDACDFILEHLSPDATYTVDNCWGPEGELYTAEIAWTLLEAYRITGRPVYLEGGAAILARLQRAQMPSGGWAAKLGQNGMEFRMTEQERRLTWERESLPVIGAVTYAAAKYRWLTGDSHYNGMIARALDHLLEQWNPEEGCFVETGNRHFIGMRSSPTAYQAFFLLGLGAWRRWRKSLEPVLLGLAEYIRRNFESFDENTMPFMRTYHAVLLMKNSSLEYITRMIKPEVDRLIASPVFRCSGITGGYGHRDSYRGIVNTEANIRGSGAAAIAMKAYDLITGSNTYRDSNAYKDVASWIDSMKAENGYYEYQTQQDGKRKGRGSPAQYIPCWWIFGDF